VDFERVVRFPQVTCDVPGAVLYCFPSGLKRGPNGINLDFTSFNFVMVRGLGDGKGVDIKCNCCCDLSVIVAGFKVHACLPASAPTGDFPIMSDLCKHARGLLDLSGQQMQLPAIWVEDAKLIHSVMLHAGQDVDFDPGDFLMGDEDCPGAPTCRQLPYSGDTLVIEFLLSEEARNRRHRIQSRFFPGSIVIRTPQASYKCCSCKVHSTQAKSLCVCVPTVRKFLLEHKRNVRKFITRIKVHKNGKSLALRGYSRTPISPYTHPHVRSDSMNKGQHVDSDWRDAQADRFVYAPTILTPSPLPLYTDRA
jgi:hypothetical protein